MNPPVSSSVPVTSTFHGRPTSLNQPADADTDWKRLPPPSKRAIRSDLQRYSETDEEDEKWSVCGEETDLSQLEEEQELNEVLVLGEWRLGEMMGRGSSSGVRIARHTKTGQYAAVKRLTKSVSSSREDSFSLDREIIVQKLACADHPLVLNLLDVFESETRLYLISECCAEGELFHFITKNVCSNAIVQDIFGQLANALAHLHLHSLCHRDIKFENILLTREAGTGRLLCKLSDLGMATFQPPGTLLSTSCGSPHYASPQLVAGQKYNGAEADIWSAGVVLFALVTGTLPFDDDNIPSLLCKIVEGDYKIPDSVGPVARDLITRMLSVDPSKRIKTLEVINHPFLLGAPPPPRYSIPFPLGEDDWRLPKNKEDLDSIILGNLRIILRADTEEDVVRAMLADDGNTEVKRFYVLLRNFRERPRLEARRRESQPRQQGRPRSALTLSTSEHEPKIIRGSLSLTSFPLPPTRQAPLAFFKDERPSFSTDSSLFPLAGSRDSTDSRFGSAVSFGTNGKGLPALPPNFTPPTDKTFASKFKSLFKSSDNSSEAATGDFSMDLESGIKTPVRIKRSTPFFSLGRSLLGLSPGTSPSSPNDQEDRSQGGSPLQVPKKKTSWFSSKQGDSITPSSSSSAIFPKRRPTPLNLVSRTRKLSRHGLNSSQNNHDSSFGTPVSTTFTIHPYASDSSNSTPDSTYEGRSYGSTPSSGGDPFELSIASINPRHHHPQSYSTSTPPSTSHTFNNKSAQSSLQPLNLHNNTLLQQTVLSLQRENEKLRLELSIKEDKVVLLQEAQKQLVRLLKDATRNSRSPGAAENEAWKKWTGGDPLVSFASALRGEYEKDGNKENEEGNDAAEKEFTRRSLEMEDGRSRVFTEVEGEEEVIKDEFSEV